MSKDADAFLPYGIHQITEADIEAVVEVLRGDWLTTGPAVAAFEQAVANAVDAPYAIACSNGTTALHLAAAGLGLGEGDIAIVPSVTFQATAAAALYQGAEVVFADVDPDTGLMTPETLQTAIAKAKERFPEKSVACIMPVHLAGRAVAMEPIHAIAQEAGAKVIEDAAHALGTADGQDKVGSCRYSDAAIFSFHPVKTVTAGEGGMVTVGDATLAERIADLRSHGMVRAPEKMKLTNRATDGSGSPNPWYYEIQNIGFNYRITDIQCALGLSQMQRLDTFVDHRVALLARYAEAFADQNAITMAPINASGRTSWHLAVALIDFDSLGATRAAVMQGLKDRGIGTQVHYIPLHMQPLYQDRYGAESLAGAEAYYTRALSLPLHLRMTGADVDRVVDALFDVLGQSV